MLSYLIRDWILKYSISMHCMNVDACIIFKDHSRSGWSGEFSSLAWKEFSRVVITALPFPFVVIVFLFTPQLSIYLTLPQERLRYSEEQPGLLQSSLSKFRWSLQSYVQKMKVWILYRLNHNIQWWLHQFLSLAQCGHFILFWFSTRLNLEHNEWR